MTPFAINPTPVNAPAVGLCVDVDAAVEIWPAHGEGLEDERQHQHPEPGDRPGDQRAQPAGRRAEGLRQGEDPTADHRADDHPREREDRDLLECRTALLLTRGPLLGHLRLPRGSWSVV
jgi:hypothetical protein